MAIGKKYYWIKLKKSFIEGDAFDFLMSQKQGSNYIVLYLMLCMQTINTSGTMAQQIGEVIVPFDAAKIQRDCKYFDYDTIVVAIELFKKLGLIYEQNGNTLSIANYNELVGSETDYSAQKRRQRNKEIETKEPEIDKPSKNISIGVDSGMDSGVDSGVDNVHIENRDKSIENRDKSIELENRDRGESRGERATKSVALCEANASLIIEAWNSLGLTTLKSITNTRLKLTKARIAENGIGVFIDTTISIKESPFLLGQNAKGWMITYDWLIKPSNFAKVLEGNYKPRAAEQPQGKKYTWANFDEI
nr:MAG TPA: Replication initiation and membrane attachment [Caudoviricetes sp.]